MTKLMSAVFLALFCLCTATAAELKIAVVDMKKIFQDYDRTKVAEKKLQEQTDLFREYSVQLANQVQTLKKEFEKARDDSQDNMTLSEAERKNLQLRAKELYEQIMIRQTELKKYNQTRGDQIRANYEKLRSEILNEIKIVVQNIAVLGGYQLVLDRSGSTSNEISAVIYFAPQMDITPQVLNDLNRAYRAQNPAPAASDADKPQTK